MMSANWGLGHVAATTIYKAVFLPRCSYAVRIWEKGIESRKAIIKLGSAQRRPLLAITGAYKTTSTAALQVLAGALPLDLELKVQAAKQKVRQGTWTDEDLVRTRQDALSEWQARWVNSKSGEWTRTMIPDVRERYMLPLEQDHYTSQIMTGHGDFRGKLHSFKLVESPGCTCGQGSETVQHVLFRCIRADTERDTLRRIMLGQGQDWPPTEGAFIRTRATYEALRTFARKALKERSDR